MGKRRDRRHAALGGGSRRTKLDLWDDEPAPAGKPAVVDSVTQQNGRAAMGTAREGGQAQDASHVAHADAVSGEDANPLQQLLGNYSTDEDEGAEDEHAGALAMRPAGSGKEHMDDQVHDFLKELQVSGLLDDGQEDAHAPAAAAAAAAAAPAGAGAGAEKASGVDSSPTPTPVPASEGPSSSNDGGGAGEVSSPNRGGAQDSSTLPHEEVPPVDGNAKVGEGQKGVELAEGWEAVLDESSGDVYYWHTLSGATSWDMPVAEGDPPGPGGGMPGPAAAAAANDSAVKGAADGQEMHEHDDDDDDDDEHAGEAPAAVVVAEGLRNDASAAAAAADGGGGATPAGEEVVPPGAREGDAEGGGAEALPPQEALGAAGNAAGGPAGEEEKAVSPSQMERTNSTLRLEQRASPEVREQVVPAPSQQQQQEKEEEEQADREPVPAGGAVGGGESPHKVAQGTSHARDDSTTHGGAWPERVAEIAAEARTTAERLLRLLAPGALEGLPLRVRLAVEGQVRAADCAALLPASSSSALPPQGTAAAAAAAAAAAGGAGALTAFWEHAQEQLRRLASAAAVEEEAAQAEQEQQRLLLAAQAQAQARRLAAAQRWAAHVASTSPSSEPERNSTSPPVLPGGAEPVLGMLSAYADSPGEAGAEEDDLNARQTRDSSKGLRELASEDASSPHEPPSLSTTVLGAAPSGAAHSTGADLEEGEVDMEVDMEMDMDMDMSQDGPRGKPAAAAAAASAAPYLAGPPGQPLFPLATLTHYPPAVPAAAAAEPESDPSFAFWVPPPPAEPEAPPPPPDEPPPPPPDEQAPLSLPPALLYHGAVTLQAARPPGVLPETAAHVPHGVTPFGPIKSAAVSMSHAPVAAAAATAAAAGAAQVARKAPVVYAAAATKAHSRPSTPPLVGVLPPAAPASSAAAPPMGDTTKKSDLQEPRGKKRALVATGAGKASKRVSSLLDKWKAAKEELQERHSEGSDDEPEDEEALERRRQLELEEWRRQQLATGQARDNANFQPLGIDWREKVKKAKKLEAKKELKSAAAAAAAAATGAVQAPGGSEQPIGRAAAAAAGAKHGGIKKPDVESLSKGLPPGWQVFWDKSSGDVYYGNLSTQETSWERPVAAA